MDARNVKQAAELYRLNNGRNAASVEELVASGTLSQAPAANHGYVIAYDRATGAVTASGACTYPPA